MASSADPTRIDWVDLSVVPSLANTGGRLGMCGLAQATMTGASDAVDTLVVLLDTPATFEELAPRTRIVRYPIADMGVPTDQVSFGDLLNEVIAEIRAGRSVVVSCMAGLGRTGMTTACVLVQAGQDAESAITLVRTTRPGTIETDAQLAFVRTRSNTAT